MREQDQDNMDGAIGGVQGTPPPDDAAAQLRPDTGKSPENTAEDTPPAAGEIEWARQVVKRPPAPDA